MAGSAAESHDDLVLGRYRPLRPLGSGGAGSVWLARDEQTGTKVALKIVPREGNAGSRAEREAATAARLRHPRCLRAYALARDPGHVYIVYEYLPGRTLRDALREGSLGDRDVLLAARQMLEGLAHAHKHRVVHRDVKPSNVLLLDGNGVSVRLLDFGLAAIEEEATLTAAGDVPGTLAYIPPERLHGQPATPAADVWAVGVVLWEGLAGRHPFWSGSLPDTARAIEAGAPSLAKARPDLPKALCSLVESALAVDPKRRPSAARLAAALARAAATKPRRRRRRIGAERLAPARLWPAAPAALVAAYGATALPFYPHGAAPALAALAAAAAFLRPRAGLAVALAVPVLPIGNLSSGAAIVYGFAALAWLGLFWRAPREGLLFTLGPLLGAIGLLPLLPLALERGRGAVRRAAGAAAGVVAASWPLVRLDGVEAPREAFQRLADAFTAQPGAVRSTVVLLAAAVLVPFVRRRGPWAAAGYGAAVMGALLLPASDLDLLPAVAAAWLSFAALLLRRAHLARAAQLVRAGPGPSLGPAS